MKRLFFLGLCATSLLLAAAPVHAAPMVTLDFENLNYTQGSSSGYVDFVISGADINAFNLQFQITGPADSDLEFTSSSGSYSGTDTYSSGDYVFPLADSLNFPGPLGTTMTDGAGYPTTLTVGDATLLSDDVTPTPLNDLLVRVDFDLTVNPSLASGIYDITLLQNANTYFQNAEGNLSIPIDPSSTLTQAINLGSPGPVVPEPGTCGLFLMGLTGLAWLKHGRGKRPGN